MKGYSLVVVFALTLTVPVWAQTGGGGAGDHAGGGSSGTQGSTTTGQSSSSDQGQASSGQASGSSDSGQNSGMSNSGKKDEKTLKGCIESQGGQYILQEKHGKTAMLSGQDLSSYAGKEVKVRGSWQSGSSGMSSSSSSGQSASNSGVSSTISDDR